MTWAFAFMMLLGLSWSFGSAQESTLTVAPSGGMRGGSPSYVSDEPNRISSTVTGIRITPDINPSRIAAKQASARKPNALLTVASGIPRITLDRKLRAIA